jgi:hypothetical protein
MLEPDGTGGFGGAGGMRVTFFIFLRLGPGVGVGVGGGGVGVGVGVGFLLGLPPDAASILCFPSQTHFVLSRWH